MSQWGPTDQPFSSPQPAGPPPGWYPDPGGSPARRWWDGQRWTDALDHGVGAMQAGGGRGTNGLAVASFVLGLLWVFFLGSILAVVFGHVSLGQIRRSGAGGRGLAIAGLVLGYLGVAFLVLGIVVAATHGHAHHGTGSYN